MTIELVSRILETSNQYQQHEWDGKPENFPGSELKPDSIFDLLKHENINTHGSANCSIRLDIAHPAS